MGSDPLAPTTIEPPAPASSGSSNQSSSSPEAYTQHSPSSVIGDEDVDGDNGNDDDDDLAHIDISARLESLALSVSGLFFGPSSAFAVVRDAQALKQEITGQDDLIALRYKKRDHFWQSPLVSSVSLTFERFKN